jgi:hypothetical protein
VCLSQKTVKFLVIEGFNPQKKFGVIDEVAPRTLSDWLGMKGEPHSSVLASVILFAMRDEMGLIPTSSGSAGARITPIEGVEWFYAHSRIRECVTDAPGTVSTLCARSMLAFAWWKFHQINKAEARNFFIELTRGDSAGPNDPIFLLRERFKRDKNAKSKLPRSEKLALIFKAWNAQRDIDRGYDPGLQSGLRWVTAGNQAEPFPEPR